MAIEQLLNERDLLKKIADGNQAAFAILFKHYHQKVFAFGKKITYNDEISKELVQEIFLKLWLKREIFLTIDNFNAYLGKTVRNHCFNVLRNLAQQEKYRQELIFSSTENGEDSTLQRLYYKDVESLLGKALIKLSPNQRRAYILCHQEGLSYKEAAEKMNVSAHTLHEYIKIALRKIRFQLSSHHN